MLAGAYLDRSGDLPFIQEIWPNIQARSTGSITTAMLMAMFR